MYDLLMAVPTSGPLLSPEFPLNTHLSLGSWLWLSPQAPTVSHMHMSFKDNGSDTASVGPFLSPLRFPPLILDFWGSFSPSSAEEIRVFHLCWLFRVTPLIGPFLHKIWQIPTCGKSHRSLPPLTGLSTLWSAPCDYFLSVGHFFLFLYIFDSLLTDNRHCR